MLGASKGSFYHHFESKTLCWKHCAASVRTCPDQAEEELQGCDAAMARLKHGAAREHAAAPGGDSVPVHGAAAFVPAEGRALRACYEAALRESFLRS